MLTLNGEAEVKQPVQDPTAITEQGQDVSLGGLNPLPEWTYEMLHFRLASHPTYTQPTPTKSQSPVLLHLVCRFSGGYLGHDVDQMALPHLTAFGKKAMDSNTF